MSANNNLYKIEFFSQKAPVPITFEEYKIVSKGMEDAKFITIRGETLNVSDIKGITHNVTTSSPTWHEPEYSPINKKNLKLLREMKQAILVRKEKYDPNVHLPEEWQKRMAETGQDIDNRLSPSDQDAINADIAHVDAEGYVIYDYQKMLRYEAKQHAKQRYVDEPYDALMRQTEQAELEIPTR